MAEAFSSDSEDFSDIPPPEMSREEIIRFLPSFLSSSVARQIIMDNTPVQMMQLLSTQQQERLKEILDADVVARQR